MKHSHVVHWGLTLMASVQITPQKRKVANFRFCAIISKGAVKRRPQRGRIIVKAHIYYIPLPRIALGTGFLEEKFLKELKGYFPVTF